jgi:multiple sugar transport system substrate-binding protein
MAWLALLFLLVVVLGLLRSDWTPAATGRKRVDLSFWNGWTGPDGRVALEMIRQFNEANPDIQVSMQRMDWATYYNKLMVAAVDGRGPEVFVIHASTLPRMQRAGFVANVTNLLRGADGIPADDFDPYVLDQTKYGNDYVGVPLDIHPQGLYCNRELLKKAGLNHPPKNGEEFVRAMRAMQKDEDGDGHPDVWGFALTLWRNNFQSLMPQFGGRYIDENGHAVLDSPENVAAMEFMAKLEKEHLVPPPENGLGWVGFRQKKVGMVFDGVYMLGDLLRLDDLSYEGAPIPQIGPKPGTMADSHVLCIRKDLDPARRNAAERFIRFLSAHSIDWARAGQVPARRSARSTPEFAKMQVQSAFAKQIPYMLYPPRTTVLFELSLEIDLAVEKVMRGRATAAEALKVANANVQRFLDRDAQERKVAK